MNILNKEPDLEVKDLTLIAGKKKAGDFTYVNENASRVSLNNRYLDKFGLIQRGESGVTYIKTSQVKID
jgi:hypothetical protein